MALNQDLWEQLQATFVAEAEEHLQAINCSLLALEQQGVLTPGEPLLAEIFRAAHSLKGAARAVGAESVAELAHRLEGIFSRVRSGELQPCPEQYDLLYRALDVLRVLVQNSGSPCPAEVNVHGLEAELGRIDLLPAHISTAPAPASVSAAAGGQAGPPARAQPTAPLAGAPPVPQLAVAHPAAPVAEESVRVTVAKLDAIMEQVGELQVTRLNAHQELRRLRALLDEIEQWQREWRKVHPRFAAGDANATDRHEARATAGQILAYLVDHEAQLNDLARRLREIWQQAEVDNRRSGQIVEDLDALVRRTRLMPAGLVFESFPRMVRDLARTLDKQVHLVIEGSDTEVDRSVLEQVKDPLIHLLRNAVDHGIETPAVRSANGKPAAGVIKLSATQHGDSIVVEVTDDGAGIDPEQIRASVVAQGHLRADEAAALSNHDVLWQIFRSGLSTRAEVSSISGRGVGLDVVREQVERMHGLIDVDSRPGQGTRFTLHLPLTVATTLCILAQAGACTFAIPATGVMRIMRLHNDAIGHAAGHTVLQVDGQPIALAHLTDVLALDPQGATATGDLATDGKAEHNQRHGAYAVILGAAERRAALLVDAVADVQELVVKSLPRPFLRVQHLTGAAILGTGEVVIVLNVSELLRTACLPGRASQVHLQPAVTPVAGMPPTLAPTILVADDSFTTRTLEKAILETAGYRVRVAADGLEAWTMLQAEASDLLVSDVMMPRMDGFELTSKIRSHAQLAHLPVILVTAQDSAADRQRGNEVGADAYILKSAFDQESLLNTIRRLI